jgi:hypothetical protein
MLCARTSTDCSGGLNHVITTAVKTIRNATYPDTGTCSREPRSETQHGIDQNQNRLRSPYDSSFLRSHLVHPHP